MRFHVRIFTSWNKKLSVKERRQRGRGLYGGPYAFSTPFFPYYGRVNTPLKFYVHCRFFSNSSSRTSGKPN